MTRSLLILSILLIQGCQLQPLQQVKLSEPEAACRIDNQRLYRLQQTESRFLSEPEKRSSILQKAFKRKDPALLALLLSTPLASKDQLQQAKRHFNKLKVIPQEACPGDSYLHSRNKLATSLLWMRAKHDQLIDQNRALQIKIDALTEIESDLTKQRETQQ